MDLLIEIKILIAAFDREAWIKLVLTDDRFREYAYTYAGRKQFIDLFTVITIGECTTYRLFDKLHRDDGPAIIHSTGKRNWYIQGKLHRDNGPAIINS